MMIIFSLLITINIIIGQKVNNHDILLQSENHIDKSFKKKGRNLQVFFYPQKILCKWPQFSYQNTCTDICPLNTVPDYLKFNCYLRPKNCDNNPCLNNGTCTLKFNRTIFCDCNTDYSGDFCEIPKTVSSQIFSNLSNIIANDDPQNITFQISVLQNSGYDVFSIKEARLFLESYERILNTTISFINSTNLVLCGIMIKENFKINNITDVDVIMNVMSKFSLNSVFLQNSFIYTNSSIFTIQVYNLSSENLLSAKLNKASLPTLNLTECVNFIVKKYDLSIDSIIVFKIDISTDHLPNDNYTLVNGFSKFNVINTLTNASFNLEVECINNPFAFQFPFNNANINYSQANTFYSNGINLLNPNDSFYQDSCFPFSSNSTDLTLKQRRDYFYKGVALSCTNGCYFAGFDDYNYTICKCTNSSYTQQIQLNSPIDLIENSNFYVIFCSHKLFTSMISQNIGFYLLIILVILEIIFYLYSKYKKNGLINKNILEIVRNDAKIYDVNNPPPKKKIYMDKESKSVKIEQILEKKHKFKRGSYNQVMTTVQKNLMSNSERKFEIQKSTKSEKSLVIIDNLKQTNNFQVKHTTIKTVLDNKTMKKNIQQDKLNLKSLHFQKASIGSDALTSPNSESIRNKFEDWTLKDIDELSIIDNLIYDCRSFQQFYFDNFKKRHSLLSAFLFISLKKPQFIRINLLFRSINFILTFNAFFDVISVIGITDLSIITRYLFFSSLLSIVFKTLPLKLIEIFTFLPSILDNEINEVLRKLEETSIETSYEKLISTMFTRYCLFFTCSIVFSSFFWYFILCFSAVYQSSSLKWFIQTTITLLFDWLVFQPTLIFIFSSTRYLAQKFTSMRYLFAIVNFIFKYI